MKAIEANTKVNPSNYYQAASYYFETGRDLKQALAWINLSLQDESNRNAYWILHQKAKIQKALGDKKGAIESATASLNSARQAQNRDYQNMNQDLIKSLQ
ncbi:MAG TPA: DUF2911 domain-containing protein, partial [Chryseosolibacter sp.]